MNALDRIDRVLTAVGAVLDWACSALRPVLPRTLATFGYRSRRRAVELDLDHGATDRGHLETSLMGQTALRAPDGATRSKGVIGVLHPEEQFTITTELSEAAARAGRAAIALRLDQLSPIPVEDAVFACQRLSPAGQLPVTVEVSIARRSQVEAAAGRLGAMDPDWRLVGQLSEDGRPVLEFDRSGRQPLGLGLKLLIVSAAIAAALLAWSGRLEQAVLDLQLAQIDLARQARDASAADRQLAAIDAAHTAGQTNPRLGDWMQALSRIGPEVVPYTAIRVTAEEVVLENDGSRVASTPAVTAVPMGSGLETGEAAP